jgi:SAM-dependent methyltransferase
MKRSRVHLGASVYAALQEWVHRGHHDTVRVIIELLGAQPGDTVIEVGCGTGALARHFIERGFDYWGVDPDADRIDVARKIGGGRFLVGTADVLATADVPARRHVFIHGVLHHVDDAGCRRILDFLQSFAGEGRFVVSEPVLPDHWWLNPAGALLARLDEGRHMRRADEWVRLFGTASVDHVSVRPLWPRWPVSMLDVRLTQVRRPRPENRVTPAMRV